jgi:glycine cleavage system H protein
MSSIPKDLQYTKEHEWIRKSGNPRVVVVGITDFAQSALGDVTYVDLPAVGKVFKKNEVFGTVESVKSVSELYAPLSGKIIKINADLANTPELVNQDPYSKAWMIELEITNESEFQGLLNPQAYEQHAQ